MLAVSMAEFRSVVETARGQGWRVEMTRSCHWRFVPPDRSIPAHVTGGSPGNPSRFIRRLRCELRRKGLVL